MENAETILHLLSDTAELEKRLDESAVKMNALVEQTENIVAENARVALDQTAYNKRYDSLISQYEAEKDTYDKKTVMPHHIVLCTFTPEKEPGGIDCIVIKERILFLNRTLDRRIQCRIGVVCYREQHMIFRTSCLHLWSCPR